MLCWKVAWTMLSAIIFLKEIKTPVILMANLSRVFNHLPKSMKLSTIELPFLSLFEIWTKSPEFAPGWKIRARHIPIVAVESEVIAIYNNIRIVILLLILSSILDEPTIRLETISGKMNSLSSRMNNSPGYPINKSDASERFIGLKRNPGKKPHYFLLSY